METSCTVPGFQLAGSPVNVYFSYAECKTMLSCFGIGKKNVIVTRLEKIRIFQPFTVNEAQKITNLHCAKPSAVLYSGVFPHLLPFPSSLIAL